MAELLYRLGQFSARRAWQVVIGWLLLLAVAVAGLAIGFRGLATSFDVPGTASSEVIAELQEQLPDFAGASGLVVAHTDDGSAFTAEQEEQIAAVVESARELPDVADVIDPFATEEERTAQTQQLDDGAAQVEDARAQLDAGQAQLDAGRVQLDAAQAQLDAARAQAEQAGAPAAVTAQLDAQQAQLDAQVAQLDAQQSTLDAGKEELDAQALALEEGATLVDLAAEIRTVSQDGSAALINVAFTEPRMELAASSKDAVIEHFSSADIEGVSFDFSTEIAQGVPALFGIAEILGVVIAGIVLLVMLGSIIAAALPIVTALVGVAIGVTGSLAFSGVVEMASVTPVLGVMLGLAVGIDYSLFILNRHRKQLLRGADIRESIGMANGTAGNAVVFAGSTVVVALLALNITGIPFLGLMGTVGAVCVLVAVAIAVTLTPALLSLVGLRVLSRRARAQIGHDKHAPAKLAPMSNVRAIVTALVAVVALLIVAVPALSMRVGLPDGGSEPADSTTYRAYTVASDAFGEGVNGPLLITATLPEGLSDDEVRSAQVEVAEGLAAHDAVVAVAPAAVSDDNTLVAFQVVPKEGPNSVSTDELVRDLRAMEPIGGDIALGVAGQAAINIDISENLQDVLPLYLAVVIGISLIIMVIVFRSILVPLIATGGFILSLFATYGALVAVFQWGWLAPVFGLHSTGPILSFLPIILVGILFGLAMDYQLFLATGMREAYIHGSPARLAVRQGMHAGRAVVTAAGLIMVAVFGGFVFAESVMIRAVGFGLAFGVLVDAFVVRMLLMPALMHLLGKSAWWLPRWLDRILPDVDVEGAKLERTHQMH